MTPKGPEMAHSGSEKANEVHGGCWGIGDHGGEDRLARAAGLYVMRSVHGPDKAASRQASIDFLLQKASIS
jgi:hypothetical protein